MNINYYLNKKAQESLERMLTTLLFIAIIISGKTFTNGFKKLPFFSIKPNARMIPFSKTKINEKLANTCFYEDDDEEGDEYEDDDEYEYEDNIHEGTFIVENSSNLYDFDDLLYTLVWFDCEDCKILYIDGGDYFFDKNNETNTPLFYKNDELIATDLFSIYEELFFKNINEY
uniref:Uncharacterized protein n=1 Tax=viral metagenome TaxID=1070528 RepID=A0A6C0LN45_9ZZZZ